MKVQFFDTMLDVMGKNKDVYLIFCGLGYPRVEQFTKEFYPGRAFNFEASEQTALDAAVGLAYDGKIPFVYTITPFLLRGFETIRTYINHEKLNVKMVGAGRDDDYSKDDGFSHDASDIKDFFTPMTNVWQYYPATNEDVKLAVTGMLNTTNPCFLSLRR